MWHPQAPTIITTMVKENKNITMQHLQNKAALTKDANSKPQTVKHIHQLLKSEIFQNEITKKDGKRN
jgi:spore cortex formation protein SpoVR/YcgB (stage V sporulation)